MRTRLTVAVAVASLIGVLVGTVTMSAHHSFAAEYDATKPLKLTGTAELRFGKTPRFESVLSARQADLDRALALPDTASAMHWCRSTFGISTSARCEKSVLRRSRFSLRY